ncbi:hypothetical protein EYW47_37145 [Paraburkholderia silviterrae]|uniref:Lipoprotein n=1 Tax=Paraburkholderia silviterrae TaxID=2528715 RepID=A0A4R5LYQ6_9BURK|nr:hypothetical protein EYW47_37145 [Paraburkholderia silviterrae]
MPRLLVCMFCVALLAACAQSADRGASARGPVDNAGQPALLPGEQIDYAGHRCGNPNTHVKTHLCLFPRRPS